MYSFNGNLCFVWVALPHIICKCFSSRTRIYISFSAVLHYPLLSSEHQKQKQKQEKTQLRYICSVRARVPVVTLLLLLHAIFSVAILDVYVCVYGIIERVMMVVYFYASWHFAAPKRSWVNICILCVTQDMMHDFSDQICFEGMHYK